MSPTVLWTEEQGYGAGDPVLSIPGSGESIPRGIEAIFRYNGLTFNDSSVIDKYRLLSIDGLDDPDVRDSRDESPSDDGETPNNAFYGGRTIALRGRIEAYNLHKLRDMQFALRTAFADITQELPLYFLTGNADNDHYINCKKFSKNQWGEEQKDFMFFREFLITLRASDPRFLRYHRNEYVIDGLDEDFTVYKTVVNRGNYWARPRIRMVGPLDDFNITNEDTGKVFALKGSSSIGSGETWELNLDSPTPIFIDQDGANKFGEFSIVPERSTDLKIRGNTSTVFSVNHLSGGMTGASQVEIAFRDSYI